MQERMIELHRALKDTGTIYLHCDWHAGHYLKVMMDDVFGNKNFLNEIIWHYESASGAPKKWLHVIPNVASDGKRHPAQRRGLLSTELIKSVDRNEGASVDRSR
jgi:DNA modification methylase